MTKRRKKEWFDDDSFWRDFYPFLFTEKRFADTAEQVDKALELTKPKGERGLDLCCGPGRCSIALAQRGFTVTGVDRTKLPIGQGASEGQSRKGQNRVDSAGHARLRPPGII